MSFETPAKDGTKLADGQHQAFAAKFAKARIIIRLGNLLEPIEELQLQDSGQLKRQTQNTAGVLKFDAAASVVQTKMTDAHKAIRQNVREETADKLECGQGHQLLFAVVAIIKILESDRIFSDRHNAVIGNGDAEDVTTEILDQLLFVIERWLDIDFPIFRQRFSQHSLNIQRAVIRIEFAIRPKLSEFKTKAVAELIGK